MTEFNNNEYSISFLKKLRAITKSDCSFLIHPRKNLAAFRRAIEMAYKPIMRGHVVFFLGFNFSSYPGCPSCDFKWFIRHLMDNPDDMEPARKILIEARKTPGFKSSCSGIFMGEVVSGMYKAEIL